MQEGKGKGKVARGGRRIIICNGMEREKKKRKRRKKESKQRGWEGNN